MMDAPPGAGWTHAAQLILRRILATVTDLSIVFSLCVISLFLMIYALGKPNNGGGVDAGEINLFLMHLPIFMFGGPFVLPNGWILGLQYAVVLAGVFHFRPGRRLMRLSVKSVSGSNLPLRRSLQRAVLKHLWLGLGVIVFLPLTYHRTFDGIRTLFIHPTGVVMLLAAACLSARRPNQSVHDLAVGSSIFETGRPSLRHYIWAFLISAPSVGLLAVASPIWLELMWRGDIYRGESDPPLDMVGEMGGDLTVYSIFLLVLTGITYMVSGRRHLPGRKTSNGGPKPAAGDEAVEGEGGGTL